VKRRKRIEGGAAALLGHLLVHRPIPDAGLVRGSGGQHPGEMCLEKSGSSWTNYPSFRATLRKWLLPATLIRKAGGDADLSIPIRLTSSNPGFLDNCRFADNSGVDGNKPVYRD